MSFLTGRFYKSNDSSPAFCGVTALCLPVNILLGVNCLSNDPVVQVIGERKLNKNSVNLGVVVQSLDLGQELELGDGGRQVEELKVHAGLWKSTIRRKSMGNVLVE